MIGLRIGARIGPKVGLAVGVGADEISSPGGGGVIAGVTRDATSGKYLPASAAEWTLLMAAAGLATGNPSDLYKLQEASGSPADSIGAKTLSAVGTLAYQQTVSGWSTKSIKTTDGVTGTLSNATFANVNANSLMLLCYAQINNTPGVQRTLMTAGNTFDADGALEILPTTPRLKAKSAANNATGTLSPLGAVRPFVIRINQTADTVMMCDDAEKLAPTFSASMGGTTVLLGGDNGSSWWPATTDYLYLAAFAASAAELSDAQVKTLLQTLGWTVAW